ncbi:MAG: coproporphyrinogen III oxidase [Lentisphaerae bacterium ADurb.BinA184]|nr:MAG: coproporphyrinogen III oxidase [Lentisphaerae bacterium ADurb.BinA184]
MRICLVNGPRFNGRPTRKTSVCLPLASLGAVARRAGHEVVGIDGILIGDPAAIAAQVKAASPDVVGLTTNTNDRLPALATLRLIRRALPHAFIVVGGPHFAYAPVNALTVVKEIDAVVVGEGEDAFLELLERLPDRRAFNEVDGLVFRDPDGQIVRNPPRQTMARLDSLPMPAWDLFDPRQYDLDIATAGPRTLGLMTTRGCPYCCAFCANSLDRRLRFLSPALAIDQVQHLHTTYGIRAFTFFDDAFLASKTHATALCEEILRRGLKITWWCGARAAGLDDDVLALMRRAGCTGITFGVETGTDEVLKAVHKNVTTAQMLEAFAQVARAGFEHIVAFLIVGLPGETPDTLDRTVRFVRQLKAIAGKAWEGDSAIGELPLIYPGTELETLACRDGTFAKDFSWNAPFLEPKRFLPLVNRRYWAVPHYETPTFPLADICHHVKRHYWEELTPGRRRRFALAPVRRALHRLGLY